MIAADQHKGTVLVVEDEPLIRTYMRDVLEEGGTRLRRREMPIRPWNCLNGTATRQFSRTSKCRENSMGCFSLDHRKWPHIGVVVTSGKCVPAPKDLPLTARFVAKPIPIED